MTCVLDTIVIKHWRKWQLAFVLLLAIWVACGIASAHLTDAQADEQIHETARALYNDSLTNQHFTYPELVRTYIETQFTHVMDKEGPEVNSTTLTWEYRTGDCSEYALLYAKMLGYYMPVTVVWGTVDGEPWGHDTVRYIAPDGSQHYADMYANDHWFHEKGTGLAPWEYVIEANQ
jgi:hypothetical protein